MARSQAILSTCRLFGKYVKCSRCFQGFSLWSSFLLCLLLSFSLRKKCYFSSKHPCLDFLSNAGARQKHKGCSSQVQLTRPFLTFPYFSDLFSISVSDFTWLCKSSFHPARHSSPGEGLSKASKATSFSNHQRSERFSKNI